jgi:hypothetical protein
MKYDATSDNAAGVGSYEKPSGVNAIENGISDDIKRLVGSSLPAKLK